MSESQKSAADSQALLQSMLQRLKLQQTPKDGQTFLHTPATADTPASPPPQDGEKRAPGSRSDPVVNGFTPQQQETGSPVANARVWGTAFSFKGSPRQESQPSLSYKTGKNTTSFSPQHATISGDMGQSKNFGQVAHTGTKLLSVRPLQDADVLSTDGDPAGASKDSNQGLKPRVYTWALPTNDTKLSPQNGVVQFGSEVQSKDADSGSPTAVLNRKNRFRLSDSKTKLWTQKIKERWKEKPGSFSKKAKQGGGLTKQGQEPNGSPQKQLPATQNVTSGADEAPAGLRDATLTLSEDHSDEQIRLSSDFELGLGSFSLLDEITTGQEWATFLIPGQKDAPDDRTPSQGSRGEGTTATSPQDGDEALCSLASTQREGGKQPWSLSASESSENTSDCGMAPTSTAHSMHLGTNFDGNHVAEQDMRSEAGQSEPMEHALSQSEPMEHTLSQSEPMEHVLGQSDVHSEVRQQTGATGNMFSAQPAEIQMNSSLRTRVQQNRKRVHGSTEGPETKRSKDENKEADTAGSVFLPGVLGDTQVDASPLSPPCSPSSAPTPRGVLKHSVSQDSDSPSQVETLIKKRRVEENRRVRFSEEILTIEPDLQAYPSSDEEDEDEEEEDEDSISEGVAGVELQMVEDMVAPARRPALPGWIKALRRRNNGKKH